MANEKRLISLDDAIKATHSEIYWTESQQAAVRSFLVKQPKVDAVEVEKYNRLVEAYHELRENFVDYVCSGVPNVAPYCLNRCDGCCDAYGWCRQSDLCQGFNPAEVILDGERKDNEY